MRVRFAPAPTGSLHIGSARTALFNYLWAKKNKGKFILRFDDTDIARTSKHSVRTIMKQLRWLGLLHDEGPYFQSECIQRYKQISKKLEEANLAYPCYCSPQQLAQEREEAKKKGVPYIYSGRCRTLTRTQRQQLENLGYKPSIRFKVDTTEPIVFEDLVRGKLTFKPNTLSDFIILKENGFPTYNFATVVDDIDMRITHVIRGEDHIPNTPKQLLIYKALSAKPPQFAHLPLILDKTKKPLSKRRNAVSISYYQREGYLPQALINYIALLGFSTSDSQQLFSFEELLEAFSFERVGRSPAIFDIDKLRWINSVYIKRKDAAQLFSLAKNYLKAVGCNLATDKDKALAALQLYKGRVKILKDFADYLGFLFKDKISYDEQGVKDYFLSDNSSIKVVFLGLKDELAKLSEFNVEALECSVRRFAQMQNISTAKLIHALRLALTGVRVGPPLFDIMQLCGRQLTIKRIVDAINFIDSKR